jgi:quercetin dioxygenase-like cupin family protein
MVHSGDEVVLRSVLRNKEPEPEMMMSLLFFKQGPTSPSHSKFFRPNHGSEEEVEVIVYRG